MGDAFIQKCTASVNCSSSSLLCFKSGKLSNITSIYLGVLTSKSGFQKVPKIFSWTFPDFGRNLTLGKTWALTIRDIASF
jgi:hypothetical protein